METLGKTGATEAIGKTKATVPAGKKLAEACLAEAYKSLADTQEKNNTDEIANKVFEQYRKAGLSK